MFGIKKKVKPVEVVEEVKKCEYEEKDIYLSLAYMAIKEDIKYIEKKIREKEPIADDPSQNVFVREWNKQVVNKVKKLETQGLSERKNKALHELERFEEEHGDGNYKLSEDTAKFEQAINEFFVEDKHGIARSVLAIRLAMDNSFQLEFKEEALGAVSLFLFGKANVIYNLYESVKDNYIEICQQEMSEISKGIFIGMGVFSAATMIFAPALCGIGAAISANVAQSLGNFGQAAALNAGVGIAKVAAITVFASSLSFCVGAGLTMAIQEKKIKEVKKQFREVSVEDLSVIFAIKATLLTEIRNRDGMDAATFKDALDDCLTFIDTLRSDAEYMLIVEKLDAGNARKKIFACDRLTARLAEIVGI